MGFAGRYAPPFPSHACGAGPSPDGRPPVAAPAPEPTVPVPASATAAPGPALCRMVASGNGGMRCRGEALTARKRSLHKCALASLRGKVRQARFNVSRRWPRNARQGKPLHPRFLESVSAGLRVSRLDSEIDEVSNGKAPLLTKRGLSKTVV